MRVFITGGSGLIGRELASKLLDAGHHPVILSRNADHVRRDPAMWAYQVIPGDPTKPGPWQEEIDGCDAVVNLAGHNVFAERWNASVKAKIRDSRVHGTEHLVAAIKQASSRPKVFVQGSAIGYYGVHQDEELTEASPSGTDFLAVVCREAEEASEPLDAIGVRRALVRTGIVLAPNEGALKIMTPIFKMGPGAPIGSEGRLGPADGSQWMSWIHIDDIVGIFKLAIENDGAIGPLNGTAPHPVRNAEFAKTFSAVLRKQLTPWRFYLPVGPPDALLRVAFGEVASVITTGQKVLPAKALGLGYAYRYPDLDGALTRDLHEKAEGRREAAPITLRPDPDHTIDPTRSALPHLRRYPRATPAPNVIATARIAPARALPRPPFDETGHRREPGRIGRANLHDDRPRRIREVLPLRRWPSSRPPRPGWRAGSQAVRPSRWSWPSGRISPWRASANSAALANRSWGLCASILSRMRTKFGGRSGRCSVIGTCRPLIRLPSRSIGDVPGNGSFPVIR